MPDQSTEAYAMKRATTLDAAEQKNIERLSVVLENAIAILEIKLRKLRMEAGKSPDYTREATHHERYTAMIVAQQAHAFLGEYPEAWDSSAIGETDIDSEQLEHDLRGRVRAALARVWSI